MTRKYNSILEAIGNTPVVRINRMAPADVELFVKIEAFNPMGSVKDRMALSVIEQAERDESLQAGQTVIEATSGNTGIGLAMVCAAKGYPLVLTMAESFSLERRKILRFLGARVVLTPAEEKGSGMLAKATELAKKHGWFLVRQFENEANADAHSRTTAVEILEAFADKPLDYFVTGYGTGGTLKGTSRVLREKSPGTRIVVCEPDNSPLLGSGIKQERNTDGSPRASHPKFRPHLMQGWTPDFIPRLAEDAVSQHLLDQVLAINGQHALEVTRRLACEEGIFCGTSGGATFSGALQVAKQAEPGSTILCMLPDTGERYLSTPLFADIDTEMNSEELEISRSTPGYRFDKKESSKPVAQKEPATPTEPPATQALSADATVLFDQVISDPAKPLVLFALEWCEFCWSVRKLFNELGINFHSVDLDSVPMQEHDLGTKLRAIIQNRTGAMTIPQIFLASKHLGGATDVFDSYKEGRLQLALKDAGVSFTDKPGLDPYHLLPNWLHSR